MNLRILFRLSILGLGTLIIVTSMTAVAATNTIPATRVGERNNSFNINYLKPSACAGITVTNLVSGSGSLTGTSGNDLILGGSGADLIDGSGGDDCILGGGGDDQIAGGDGSDTCIGGSGTDVFTTCEGEFQ
ncbi:MAG: hypothetical protein C3F07_12400 [Anaerolineales bacterium]|nr:MAG: hypothetical protein C3F07_12400 [Anaerolineales bacterium]